MQLAWASAPNGPDWAAILEAVSAAVSALLLGAGAWFAQRYLARGNTSVEATVFEHPGGLGLHVRPSIQSLGLSALRLSHKDDLAPTIEVVEYRIDDGSPFPGLRRETFTGDDLVGPGESVTGSEVFLVSTPSTGTLGWRIIFDVGVRRRFKFQAWRWVAATFVPLPGTSTDAADRPVSLSQGNHDESGGESGGSEVKEQGEAR
jgi:hypothetical protein